MADVGEETLGLLTVKQVAELLNTSAKTVYRLIWHGELDALTVGTRARRIEPEAVEAYKSRVRAAAHAKSAA